MKLFCVRRRGRKRRVWGWEILGVRRGVFRCVELRCLLGSFGVVLSPFGR